MPFSHVHARGQGKPGSQYAPRPSVAVFGGSEGQREWIQLADGDARINRVMTIPPGGAWLHGEGYLDCDSTSGVEATVSPQLGEYEPLFLAGAEGCYRSFACPWCWRLLWGGSAWPRYEQIDSKKRVFMPEGATVITLRAIKSTARNTDLGLFVGQWNCDALEELKLAQAVDATTAAIAPAELVSSRVFLAEEDTVPLLLRFFNANGVEEYGVCPGTKIAYGWNGADAVELMSAPTPGLFVANVPVPKLATGKHKLTVSATPAGTTKRYAATIDIPVVALDIYLDAKFGPKDDFNTRKPHDDLPGFVPGSDIDTGASVLITEQTGQEIMLWVGPSPPGEIRADIEQVSRYPGIAMNYPIENAATTPDMDFGAGSLGPVKRTITKSQKWASFPLFVRDYAASATIKITLTRADGKQCLNECTRRVQIPIDKNGNGLPDAGWLAGTVNVPDLGMAPGSDEDKNPAMDLEFPPLQSGDAGEFGDGLTNFEEYRGFIVRGEHRRTNPFHKDLFIVSDDYQDLGYARALPVTCHRILGSEIAEDRGININSATLPGGSLAWPHGHHRMRAVKVTRDDEPGLAVFGTAYIWAQPRQPRTPNLTTEVVIYTLAILEAQGDFGASDDEADSLRRSTMAHEIGHTVNLYHNTVPESMMYGGSFYKYQTFQGIPSIFSSTRYDTYLFDTTMPQEDLEIIPDQYLERCDNCGRDAEDPDGKHYGHHLVDFQETDTLRLREPR